jgi:predicted lipid-binding transport protein (Tim44 family)
MHAALRWIALAALAGGAALEPAAWARGGGGCLAAGTLVATPTGAVPVERLQIGNTVLSRDAAGRSIQAAVCAVYAVQPDEFFALQAGGRVLRVTGEHPVQTAPGTWTRADCLAVNSPLGTADGPVALDRVTRQPATSPAYNLLVSPGGTFFADGFLVHNKGCFLPDTPVTLADGSTRAISAVRPGDTVLAFDSDETVVPAKVHIVLVHEVDSYLIVRTETRELHVTEEHPFYVGGGVFKTADALRAGDRIMVYDGHRLAPATLLALERVVAHVRVYNLQTEEPHTFFASGAAVHNKGGGGGGGGGGFGGGGFHSGSGSGSGPADPVVVIVFLGIIVVFVVISVIRQHAVDSEEDLDYCFSREEIAGKLAKTQKLLAFISKVDDGWTESRLQEQAEKVFRQLQQCWEAREYAPMEPLLMPDLYAEHVAQLKGLRETHEINRIEQLQVEAVDIVHVNYTEKADHRSFTALITASARDYYVDDRDQSFRRGDDAPARFQEFWTFHWYNGGWRLREIEQSRESNVLAEENFFEQFTDVGLAQIYDETAGQAGPVGPNRPAEVGTKAQRIERLLNFLVQTDRMWDREAMLGTVRRVYLNVLLAWQDGRPDAFAGLDLSPELAQHLGDVNTANQHNDCRVEYRNLCVRKVELVHVNNRDDRQLDEFTALVSAHAQVIVTRAGRVEYRDPDVRPLQDYWTFGRADSRWVLREILPTADGVSVLRKENVDEGSSPEMLEWFYSKTRAT